MNLGQRQVPAVLQVLENRALVHHRSVAVLVQHLQLAHDFHCHGVLGLFVVSFPHPAEPPSADAGQHHVV